MQRSFTDFISGLVTSSLGTILVDEEKHIFQGPACESQCNSGLICFLTEELSDIWAWLMNRMGDFVWTL